MGKQNNVPVTLSQEEYDKKLETNISQLIDKGFSDDDIRLFGEDFKKSHIVKKKDEFISTSTTKTPSMASVPKTGSLATPKQPDFLKPKIGQVQSFKETPQAKEQRLRKELSKVKVTPENQDLVSQKTDELSATIKQNKQLADQYKSNRIKAVERDFYANTTNANDDIEAEQRLKDKLSGTGILNTITDFAKKAYNTAIEQVTSMTDEPGLKTLKISEDPLADEKKEVKKQALKNKESITNSEVDRRAKELFKNKEKENLFIDRANSFLDNLPEEDRLILKQDRAKKATHLQEDNTKRLKLVSALQQLGEDKIKDYKTIESQLLEFKKTNQPLPQDLYNQYESLGSEIQGIGQTLKRNEEYILKNKKDLGTAQEEFDLFKREYGDLYNFAGNVATSAGELALNTLAGLDYLATFGGNIGDKKKNEGVQQDISRKKEFIKSQRENLRKPVESIESPEGFINYASDLVANQIPNLVATSTGAKGLTLLGTASAGQKYSEMSEEVSKGEAKYTPLQMAVAPLLYGSAEVISEIPTLSILKKGGRVLESISKNEANLLTKTAKEKAKEWAKDYGIDMSKEMSGEQFTNFAQNFNDKFVLGKKDVNLLDNTGRVFKDTFTLTSILKAAPQTFGAIAQQFQSNSDLEKLDENSRKIIDFSKQINSGTLNDVETQVIQKQIDKLTENSSKIVENTINKIDNMPNDSYDEIIKLNSRAGEIKSQAKEINAGSLPNKKELLNGLQEEYKDIQEKRLNIIENAKTETSITGTTKTKPQAEVQKSTDEAKEKSKEVLTKKEDKDAIQKRSTEEISLGEQARDSKGISGENTERKKIDDKSQEEKITDESISESDIIPNGNIRLRTNKLEEGRIEQPETNKTSIEQELQPTTTTESDKANVKRVKSVKDAEYDIEVNDEGNVISIKSIKDGREIPKFVERVNPKTNKVTLVKNSNYTKIEADALGYDTENKAKLDREKEVKLAVDNITETDPYNVALKALINGAKVSKESLEKETGNIDSKWATNQFSKETLPSFERLSEIISEDNPDLDQTEVRNALIDIVRGHSSMNQLKETVVDTYNENTKQKQAEEERAYLGSLSEKDLAMYESIKAEDDYINDLTDSEVEEYYNQKANEYEQGKTTTETINQRGENITEGDEGTSREKKSTEVKSETDDRTEEQKSIAKKFDDQLAQWDKNLENFGKDTLGIHLPLVIARGSIKVMRAGLQAGMTIEKAIKEGIDYIKNTDWYQNLDDYKKSLIDENSFKSVIDATIKANTDAEKKIESLKERIKAKSLNQKQLVDEVKNFLVENSIDGLLTPDQANILIKKANNILVATNTDKAFDEFVEYYNKVKAKSESKVDEKAKRKLKYEKMKQQVLDAKAKGTKLNYIISQIESSTNKELSEKEKEIITMIYKSGDVENMTNEEAKKIAEEGFARTDEVVAKSNKGFEKFKEPFKGLKRKFVDAQSTAKELLKNNDLTNVKDRLIALKGASGLAEKVFESAKEKIYKGLNTENRKTLDKIIQLRRIIAIDENRAKIDLPPVLHTNYINGEIAKKAIEQYKSELGEETFNDLNKIADAYFDEFRIILNKMESNGLINEQTRKELFEIDYQPRKFLQHMLDGNEEISENKKSWQKSTANLSADQIMGLDEGSVEAMITNSEWLLGTYMNMRERSMAMNTLNSKMMTEFNKKSSEINELKKKSDLTKKEQNKINEFEKLQKVFIDNPIVGVNKSGNPKYKFDSTPNGYRTAYYYKNGVQHKFFIKEDIYEEWYNEKNWFGNPKLIEDISIISGSKLLKNMATGRNPFFLITNTPRDFIATLALSPEYSVVKPLAFAQLTKDLAKSVKVIATKSDLFDKYFQYGGGMAFLSMQGQLTGQSTLKSFLDGKSDNKIVKTLLDSNVKEKAGKIFDWATLHEINTYSEMVFRLSIFDRAINNRLKELGVDDISKLSKEQQDDIYFSAVNSARSIMDFNQGGYITKDLESFMPYLNAATQGTRVLASGFINRPLETTAGMLQITAMGVLGIIGLSNLFIGLGKDDDDERSPTEIYLDNLEKVSPYDRRNNFIIFTGLNDEEGNPQYVKIAKSQQITPFTEAAEHFTINALKRQFGKKEDNDLLDKMMTIANDNISPVQFVKFKDDPSLVGSSLIARNPYGRAVMTYTTGYDFYRQEKLSWDIDKKGVPKYMEGYTSDRVDDFYKVLGENLEFSPIRMKAAVESIITSPGTNPILSIPYGTLDAVLAENPLKNRAILMRDNILKNSGKRIVGYGKDYNTTIKDKEALQEKIERIQADNIKFNKNIDDLSKAFINKTESKEVLTKRLIKEAKLEPYKAERAIKKIIDKQKYKDVDQFYIDLKWEDNNEVKAMMLYDKFGDFSKLKPEEQKKAGEQLDAIGFKFNDEIIFEYSKLKEKYN